MKYVKKPGGFKSDPLVCGCSVYKSSSQEASDISNSALISAFVFSWGMVQSEKALSLLSLHVLQTSDTSFKEKISDRERERGLR